MSCANSLLSKLESYLSCVQCHYKLVHPKIINSCQHSICRICLDQLLSRSSPLSPAQCPECHKEITDSNTISPIIRNNYEADRLLDCYYNIRRLSKEHTPTEAKYFLQRTESVLSDNTIETIENVPTSPFALQPLVSDSSPCNSQPMTPNRSSSSAAVHRADLVDKLVNDSDSDTDLDLPDPSTILSTSSPIRQGPDAAVTCVPETPPSLLFSSREDTQQNLTPKSSQQRVTTTYSAKNSPRAATSSRRSLNANLDMQQENGNGSPTRKRRREALLVGASSLTAVNGSSIIDDADRNITVSKDAKAPQSATPRRGRKRTLETAEKKTSISQTPQRKKTTSNKDINAAAENKCADTNGVALRLLTTGLSDAQLGRLRRATKQIKQQQLASTIDIHNNTELLGIPSKEGGYTHLIAAVGKDGRASRTFKYLTALTSGAWLVTVDWLLESAKACKLLPEANFAVMGDCALPQYSLAGPRPVNELLCKYQIHLWPSSGWDSSAHSQADLQRLIRSTGAEIIDALPVFEDTNTAIENAATSDLRGEALDSSGARHSTGSSAGRNIDREIKTVPTKYRWLFELPVCESSPVVLVDTSSLKGARSNIALGNIVSTTGGTIPCRTKSWLFDCISANIIL